MTVNELRILILVIFYCFSINFTIADDTIDNREDDIKGHSMNLLSLTNLLLNDQSTVDDLSGAVGGKKEKRRRGYWLESNNDEFIDVWLGVDLQPTGEEPLYLTFGISPEAELNLEDLTQVFGDWERLPARPGGRDNFVVLYQYDVKSLIFCHMIIKF